MFDFEKDSENLIARSESDSELVPLSHVGSQEDRIKSLWEMRKNRRREISAEIILNRIARSIKGESIAVPEGLTRDEKRKFILDSVRSESIKGDDYEGF